MTPPLELALPVALLCGILGLDRRSIAQVMVSSALVAGGLTGWWCGDVLLGLKLGAVIALLWSNVQPVGGVIPPNETVVACLATLLAASWREEGLSSDVGGALALLWAIPAGLVAARLDILQRRWNGLWLSRNGQLSPELLCRGLQKVQGTALMMTFVNDFTVCLVGALLGLHLVGGILPFPGLTTGKALVWAGYLFPLLGIAAAIQSVNRRRTWGLLAISVVLYYFLEPALPPLLTDVG